MTTQDDGPPADRRRTLPVPQLLRPWTLAGQDASYLDRVREQRIRQTDQAIRTAQRSSPPSSHGWGLSRPEVAW